MANLLYANNAVGTLAGAITNSQMTLTLNAAPTAFPSPTPPQAFYATITDAATQTLIEIVKVTAVSGNIFSIVRGQDGTSPLSWNAGDIVSQRTIALELRGFENAAEGNFAASGVAIAPSTALGIAGTVIADNANAGAVGEYFTTTGGSFPLTSGVNTDTLAITLQPGDWDVQGVVLLNPFGSGAVTNSATVGVTLISGVFEAIGNNTSYSFTGVVGGQNTLVTPLVRVNTSIAQAVIVEVVAGFAGGSLAFQGFIRARRVR